MIQLTNDKITAGFLLHHIHKKRRIV